MPRLLLALPLLAPLAASPLTYDNLPLGETGKPLLLRTYVPDPGLPSEVFAHHDEAANSPKYTAKSGRDVNGEYKPIKGIAAAIAVNHGPALSYTFDTTECRMLYAWQGGFLDMFPYWGDPKRGNRRSFGYVPALVGTVFHITTGEHPLTLKGESVSKLGAPEFQGYELDPKGVPTFHFRFGDHAFSQRIEPLDDQPFSCRIHFRSKAEGALGHRDVPTALFDRGTLVVNVRGKELSKHSGFPRNIKIDQASADAGEKLFQSYGCIACHSTDGSAGHGPSLAGLAGGDRKLVDDSSVVADAAYLRESILEPNAKTAQGFPPNYMPPYPLKDKEVESLVLFIQNLPKP